MVKRRKPWDALRHETQILAFNAALPVVFTALGMPMVLRLAMCIPLATSAGLFVAVLHDALDDLAEELP